MTWEIIQPGLFSTMQDGGRYGQAHLGIPVSGFMDTKAAHWANRMVDNPVDEAVIEVTGQGLSLSSHCDCTLAVAGAEFACTVNQKSVSTDQPIQLNSGDHFAMNQLLSGMRACLSVHAGFAIEPVLGSRSTLVVAGLGGWQGRALQTGDQLPLNQNTQVVGRPKPTWSRLKNQSLHILRATAGPEFDWFDPQSRQTALGAGFVLSNQFNRQGLRLNQPAIALRTTQTMPSSPLVPGTLQITPDGQSILAMQDGQTTGGYPRLLVVNQSELHKAAQVRPGERIYFFLA